MKPSFALSKEFGSSKPVPIKRIAVYQMLLDHRWMKNDEQAWNDFWPSVENYLRHEAADVLNQKSKKKSFALNWVKYAASLDKRASQLMLGYLCSLENNQSLVFDIQKKSDNTPDTAAFCQTANKYLEKDNSESFDKYYAAITNDELKTSIQMSVKEKDESTWSVEIHFTSKTVEKKKAIVCEMDDDSGESALLLLKDFFSFNLKDKNPDELNNLFSVAWTLWKERLPTFSNDPCSQLLVEKNTLENNLWSFCETVLLWYSTRNNTPSKTCSFPEKPFDKPDDVTAFSLFCRHLSYQWFGWKFRKQPASPAQIMLAKRTKTPGLCENDDSAFSLVLDSDSDPEYPDESLLQSLFVKGFRCLIHKSYFTNTSCVSYAPAKKPDQTQESRILYFVCTALLYFGFKEGLYTCSWNPEQNTFTVDQKVLTFSAEQKSVDSFAAYLSQEQFTKSKKTYSLLCIPSEESSSEFTLSIT